MTLANTIRIRTPEGVVFSLPLAGPVVRFLAWTVDLAAIAAASSGAGQIAKAIAPMNADIAQGVYVVAYFVVSVGYGMALEWYWGGQTLGKRLFGLRVMDSQALRLTPAQVAIRNLLRFVDSLPATYLVGGAACFLSRHSQRLGDMAANTVVVRTRTVPPLDVEQLADGKYNSLLEHPQVVARLRRHVPPEAAALAADAVLRRDQFDDAARLELFAQFAAYFRGLVAMPEEVVEGMSGERLVRNVVEALYRR